MLIRIIIQVQSLSTRPKVSLNIKYIVLNGMLASNGLFHCDVTHPTFDLHQSLRLLSHADIIIFREHLENLM